MTVPKKKKLKLKGIHFLLRQAKWQAGITFAVVPQWQFPTTDIPSEIQL